MPDLTDLIDVEVLQGLKVITVRTCLFRYSVLRPQAPSWYYIEQYIVGQSDEFGPDICHVKHLAPKFQASPFLYVDVC